ncbi:MAG: ribosomal L7Ae/L30e/S12e/Gadd45 family protein [Candidatus Aenigmarchaeota archaeon]|nr:ribosomal L7Ae/L30e/S12e/Gadd45 family protein [Candidatus Aenigmarchaeota archaeon]
MTVEKDVKEAMKAEKLAIGAKSVFRGIKAGTLVRIICSNNCDKNTLHDLNYYSKNFSVETKTFAGNSRQLGEICAKPFNIMLLGIKK